jgi:hypothetical protein
LPSWVRPRMKNSSSSFILFSGNSAMGGVSGLEELVESQALAAWFVVPRYYIL